MQIKVTFYGEIAQLIGEDTIHVQEIETVHELYKYLEHQYPKLTTQSFKIMVNDELINHERKLEENDEVLLVAPHVA